MLKVKNHLIGPVFYVKEEYPVNEAIKLLVEKNITGLPVVTDDMHLLGIITEKDILKSLYTPENDHLTVKDLMTRNIVSFTEEDDLITIGETLMQNNFRRVPIVTNGKLVGVISRKDVMKVLFKLRPCEVPEDKIKL